MRQGYVFYKDILAGTITEGDDGFTFEYESSYLETSNARPVSLTLPIGQKKHESKILFPFFDGLIPEGWLLNIALNNWKINARDRFGLLLALCKDCIGCVSVLPKEN